MPKVANPTELKDYRSISILPILSEVYKKQVLQTPLKNSKYTTKTNVVIAKTTQLQLFSQNYMSFLN